MKKGNELLKNTFIITLGKICTQFISFLLLPLYTALLSTEEMGVVDLVSTYAQLLLPIFFLQIDQALFRFLIDDRMEEKKKRADITSVVFFFVLQLVVFSIFYMVTSRFVTNEMLGYLYLTVISMGLSNIALQTARGVGDNILYSVAALLCGGITVICNVVFIVGFGMKSEGLLISIIIGNLFAFFVVFIKLKLGKYIKRQNFDLVLLRKMILYALPLVPNALIWWIVNASDRSIVLGYMGTSANGVLSVAHKFPTLILTFYNIFHISWTESAALHLKEEDRNQFFSDVFEVIFRAFVAITILLIAIMPFIFNTMINEAFSDAYNQIPILAFASLFNVFAGMYSVIYISEMKTKEIAKTSIFAGLINVVINFGLIRFIGLYAASISSVASFGVMSLYRLVDSRKYVKQRFGIKLGCSALLMLILVTMTYYLNYPFLRVMSALVAIIYGIYINKKNVLNVVRLLKHRFL